MILNGIKYACSTCIKGHRASNCKHTDRPLFEIRKKGRPVSQCLLCRDLRKTKQLHIKCICNKNKKDNISKNSVDPCDCQGQQKNELFDPSSSSPSSSIKRPSPIIIPSQPMRSSSSTSSNSSSGSSPPSYSWALVSEENHHQCQIHSQQNMGYVFQKSNQERRRRLSKSLKGASSPSSSSSSSILMPNSIQSSLVPSHSRPRPKKPPSQPNTTTSSLLDNYLATNTASLPLSRSISSSSPTLDHDMMKELDDDLCNLLDNMIYQQQQQEHLQHHQQDDLASQLSSTPPHPPGLLQSSSSIATTHSPSLSSTSSVPLPSMGSTSNSSSSSRNGYQGDIPSFYGQCQKLAQWHPQSPPPGQVGESVIITMTPLPKWNSSSQQNDLQTSQQQQQQQQQTTISTTKIVTCYCGPSCTCPGCLVHPTSSIFASQGLDPYAGYPIQQSLSSDED